ncbi:MAG: hypothetical protein Unbinned4120contig1000_5 [Prokaryotic dsDNA virus sp.]|jgi:hypothetical protein|nr:MAG: hypothetical protein Unbinned4120contig1000_5 [Prokaryotic dsDNA virus sp.]|tara:strand:+ start:571 stop:1353 length:783 start_codon:yes stop_codon:yes gene_type:complete
MRITLNQEEIEEAIEKLILDQVDVPDDIRIDIDLKATRGDEGYTAEIDLLPFDAPTDGTDRSVDPRIGVANGAEGMSIADKTEEAIAESKLPRRRGRPAGAKNKPKTHRRLPDEPEAESAETETEVESEIETDTKTEVADSDGGTNEGLNVEPTSEPDERSIGEVEADAGEAPVTVQEDVQTPSEPEEAEAEPEQPTEEPTEEPVPTTKSDPETLDPEPEPEPEPELELELELEPKPEAESETPAPAPTRSLFGHVRTNN